MTKPAPIPPPTPRQMLRAVPTPNARARTVPAERGAVVHVPIQKRWFHRGPTAWLLPLRDYRKIGLDSVGADVWDACDGRTQAGVIIERFALRHRLRFHEARMAVLHLLRDLTQRGALVMVGLEPEGGTGDGAAPPATDGGRVQQRGEGGGPPPRARRPGKSGRRRSKRQRGGRA